MKANDNNIFFWEKMNAFLIVVNAKVKMKPFMYLEHKSIQKNAMKNVFVTWKLIFIKG